VALKGFGNSRSTDSAAAINKHILRAVFDRVRPFLYTLIIIMLIFEKPSVQAASLRQKLAHFSAAEYRHYCQDQQLDTKQQQHKQHIHEEQLADTEHSDDSHNSTTIQEVSRLQQAHAFEKAKQYQLALDIYKDLIHHDPSITEIMTNYVGACYSAATCCAHLCNYAEEYMYCDMALGRMKRQLDERLLGEQRIACSLLMARSLGRQRRTQESVALLRECRALIRRYTPYASVKEYQSVMEDGRK
jgi:hypothetical protein